MTPNHSRMTWYSWSMLFAYVLLLAYGTLFPLSNWHSPGVSPFTLMLQHGLGNTSKADMLTNILVYMPLGMLLVIVTSNFRCRFCRLLLATVFCALLSLSLEYTQAHLPGRVPSLSDLILNTMGGGIGAMVFLLFGTDSRLGNRLILLRKTYLNPGPLSNLGLVIVALWILSQLSPLVPSIDLGNLRQGLKPLAKTILAPSTLQWIPVLEYASAITVLGILGKQITVIKRHYLSWFMLLVSLVLLLKIPVIGRQLSLESVLGFGLAIIALPFMLKTRAGVRAITAYLLVLATVVFAQIYHPLSPSSITHMPSSAMNMVPFKSHLNNSVLGLIDILGVIWPFMLLSYFAIQTGQKYKSWTILSGAIMILGFMFYLEWNQQFILGRSPDITDVLLAVLGWLIPWCYPPLWNTKNMMNKGNEKELKDRKPESRFRIFALAATTMTVVVLSTLWLSSKDSSAIDSRQELLPAKTVTNLDLPGFKYQHPRLPAPSPEEIALLKQYNKKFINSHRKMAKGGKGKFYSSILMAYIEPGSIDMDLLFKRLMELKISWRGHVQGKPLAMAYDWLYHQWSEEQRSQLLEKLTQATDYLINFIVVKKLSPYNVILYNSPLQALMATAIASYGDTPKADSHMQWTHDYWKQRVLPVWRQIMGKNGGWHEGGEYVAIGIGDAVYQLPAMWRKATGEDLFASETGIRGFLDFIVYRTRPDQTHMRMGDIAYFNTTSPDRNALAIEYGHKAAYSHFKCPPAGKPTSWPWGPLSNNLMCDKKARESLPLQHLFDGIGLVVARSDWNNDATYLTFKAGDNFWSHNHLDQGAFTLFKGAPLAIDSGLYGPKYNSDHHMNYTYQTVAHNTITVTDPEDTVNAPPPGKNKPPRSIANDGGQRRIGSGWGIERGPLDINEWLRKRSIYHTGKILKYYTQDNLLVAVADLAPAYTNSLSGKGTFSHRTRRVERYLRTIVYDRSNDLAIVHDDLTSTDPIFKKRSLVHTINRPVPTKYGFKAANTRQDKKSSFNGTLDASILFPVNANVDIVGGAGKEFFVDGTNYDENGEIWKIANKVAWNKHEPGSWRVEISPPEPRNRDQFLMVLKPGIEETVNIPVIERISDAKNIGAKISGVARSLEVRYPLEKDGVIVKLGAGTNQKSIDLTLDQVPRQAPMLKDKNLWDRLMEKLN